MTPKLLLTIFLIIFFGALPIDARKSGSHHSKSIHSTTYHRTSSVTHSKSYHKSSSNISKKSYSKSLHKNQLNRSLKSHSKTIQKSPSVHKKNSKVISKGISKVSNSSHHKKSYCASCQRDEKGKIKRSEKAREAFKRSHPCPSTGKTYGPCPGYVIDHVKALKHGGKDEPSNMQWQTKAAAKEKDKWE